MPFLPWQRFSEEAVFWGSERSKRELAVPCMSTTACPNTYTTNVAVSRSQIHATGHALIQGSGHIDASDRVIVTLAFYITRCMSQAVCTIILARANGRRQV
jgi:hypothetical protein